MGNTAAIETLEALGSDVDKHLGQKMSHLHLHTGVKNPMKPKSPKTNCLRGASSDCIAGRNLGRGSAKQSAELGSRRSIKLTSQFLELFCLGKNCLGGQVMPDTKPGSEVRYAKRARDGREVVVKIRQKYTDNGGAFNSSDEEAHFRTTMEGLLNLPSHPSICNIYEVLEDADAYYVVMERVAGLDLCELLCKVGRLHISEVREILRQLLSALSLLHARGWVHRDLKVEHVMLERVRTSKATAIKVKIIDYDTMGAWPPRGPLSVDVLGTDQYIAPEAYAGKYSPASDMFAVGVIAYRLLAEEFPFDATLFTDEAGENTVGNPKMIAIRESLSHAAIRWDHFVFQSSPGARRLWQRVLAIDEKIRPKATDVLADPWLSRSADAMKKNAINASQVAHSVSKVPDSSSYSNVFEPSSALILSSSCAKQDIPPLLPGISASGVASHSTTGDDKPDAPARGWRCPARGWRGLEADDVEKLLHNDAIADLLVADGFLRRSEYSHCAPDMDSPEFRESTKVSIKTGPIRPAYSRTGPLVAADVEEMLLVDVLDDLPVDESSSAFLPPFRRPLTHLNDNDLRAIATAAETFGAALLPPGCIGDLQESSNAHLPPGCIDDVQQHCL